MAKKITLHLKPEIVARALELAEQSGRHIEEVLTDWLDQYADNMPVETLSDSEVLSLCDFEMNPTAQLEMRDLLYRHRERHLTDAENARLEELLQTYRRGIVRRTKATEVAIARGLRPA